MKRNLELNKQIGAMLSSLARHREESEPDEFDSFVFGTVIVATIICVIFGAITAFRANTTVGHFILYVGVGALIGFAAGIIVGLSLEKVAVRISSFLAWLRRVRFARKTFDRGAMGIHRPRI